MRILPTTAALLLSTLAVIRAEEKGDLQKFRELSCLIYDDLSFYDLRPLKSAEGGYHKYVESVEHKYNFNLCDFTAKNCPKSANKTFAYKTDIVDECY